MIQRCGEVVIQMLANVRQVTIKPLVENTVLSGSLVHTDEHSIYNRLEKWGYQHKCVNHSIYQYARDEDGDGFWSLLRSWSHRGISQEKLPLYLGLFEFVHNVGKRGKALLHSLIHLIVQ